MRSVQFVYWRTLLSSASAAPFVLCYLGEHSLYLVCPMARSSPRGHTLLLYFCPILIFREQLFQRINTLPCRRSSRKHPASDSGSRCPSSWTLLCQNRRGFVSWAAKGWELQTLCSRAWPKEITFQSTELKLWSCWLKNAESVFILAPSAQGFLASPFFRSVLPTNPYTPLRLLGGGDGWAPGGQVMSLLTPSTKAFRLNQNWLFIILNTLPYSGVEPFTFLLLIGFTLANKVSFAVSLKKWSKYMSHTI